MNRKLKPLLAALGLALASAPAAAGVVWHFPITTFEDSNLDSVYFDAADAGGNFGTLSEGDVLIAAFEIDQTFGATTGPDSILPSELTGVSAIQVISATDLNGSGALDLKFGAYSGGMDAILALGGVAAALPNGDGLAGGKAMVAAFLDDTPNFNALGGTSCATGFADCIADASDGLLYQVDGLGKATDLDADEYWLALDADGASYADIAAGGASDKFLFFNFGLSTYYRNLAAGHLPTSESLPCHPVALALGECGSGNGLLEMTGSGDVLGGTGLPTALLDDGVFGRSDFDISKQPIPEPGSIALLAAGLLGLGASLRRRRA